MAELRNIHNLSPQDKTNLTKVKEIAITHFEELLLSLPDAYADREEVIKRLEGMFELKCPNLPNRRDSTFLSLIRQFLQERIDKEPIPLQEKYHMLISLNKAVDICLSNTLSDEAIAEKYSPLNRYQRWMISKTRLIGRVFDGFILLTLLVVGLFIVAWIIYEFYMVLTGSLPLERGGLSILGSILILYAITELFREQIKYTRGGTVSIKAFVGVALAAVIRKVLIVSLSPEKFYELITLAFILLALGVVFLLIHKVESSP